MDRCKNVFVYKHDYPPLQGPVEGAGQAGRGIEEQVSSAAQRTGETLQSNDREGC